MYDRSNKPYYKFTERTEYCVWDQNITTEYTRQDTLKGAKSFIKEFNLKNIIFIKVYSKYYFSEIVEETTKNHD